MAPALNPPAGKYQQLIRKHMPHYVDGLAQECGNSSVSAMQLLQSYT